MYVNIFVFLMYLCVYSNVYAGVIYSGICSLKHMVVSFDFLIKKFIMANCIKVIRRNTKIKQLISNYIIM